MITSNEYSGKYVAVYGLGRTGLSAIRSLKEGGADIVAWDDSDEACQSAGDAGALIMHPSGWNWLSLSALVLSPGVPLTHPEPHSVVTMARDAGVPVIGDTELFAKAVEQQAEDARVIVVTGTNGKSTTTSLIAHMLKRCGQDVQVGGNIGTPVLDLEPPTDESIYVLELSSYQADLTLGLAPTVSILLNITPDHLERHGGFDGYVAAKRQVIGWTPPEAKVILGVDSPATQSICTELTTERGDGLIPVSVNRVISHGMFVIDGVMWDGMGSQAEELIDLRDVEALPGEHNWENVAAAFACGKAMGFDTSRLLEGIRTFPGLAHRQELVAELNGVKFINDSKATNGEAAAKALACYDKVFWIAGGRQKDGGIGELKPLFSRVKRAYLIGEAAPAFAATLGSSVDVVHANTLDRAVELAAQDAAEDGSEENVVLLSPACASFDHYPDFEIRGEAFRSAVNRVIEKQETATDFPEHSNGGAVA